MKNSSIPSLALLLAALAAAPLQAQQETNADPRSGAIETRLDALVASHESVSDRQRGEIAAFLLRSDVQEIARSRGVEMERVRAAAGALTNTQVGEVSALVATIAPVQDGNGLGSVTISVVAIIIILLVLILVT